MAKDQTLSEDEASVIAAMQFDPFADDGSGETEESQGAEASSEGQDSVPVAENTEGAPAPEGEQPPAEVPQPEQQNTESQDDKSELEITKQALRELQEQVKQFTSQQPNQQQQAPANADGNNDAEMSYQFNIPPQLMRMMDSEDPAERQQGITHFANGVANEVHKNIMGQMQQAFTGYVPQLVQQMLQTTTVQKQVFDDFYGKYPELNRPELYPMVQNVGQAVMQETGLKQWSPQLRDAIAKRMQAILNGGAMPTTQAPAPQPTAPQQQPFMAGTTSRPAPAPRTAEDEIAETLGFA